VVAEGAAAHRRYCDEPGRIDEVAPAQLAEWKAGQFYNSEHLEVMGMHGGLDDQEFFFKSKVAGKDQPGFSRRIRRPGAQTRHPRDDLLQRPLVHRRVRREASGLAPDHESGKPVSGVYDNGTDFCLNTPWREWVLPDLARPGRLRRGQFYGVRNSSTP